LLSVLAHILSLFLMSKIFKRYSSAPHPLSSKHKDEEEKQEHSSMSHILPLTMEQDEGRVGTLQQLLLSSCSTSMQPDHTTPPNASHPSSKRRKHTHHPHSFPSNMYDSIKTRRDEFINEEEGDEDNEGDEDHGEHLVKMKKRKQGGGRKSKNIPQCTRCNERAAWKHDKKGKRWFCKHCKLPFTPGVVPLNKPKRETGDMPACGRCGNTVGWRHDKSRFFCKKCRRPFRPDEVESDEELMGYTSSDSRDRENVEHRDRETGDRGVDNDRDSFTPSPDNDVDDRESFLDLDASKILMALKSDRLYEVLSSSD